MHAYCEEQLSMSPTGPKPRRPLHPEDNTEDPGIKMAGRGKKRNQPARRPVNQHSPITNNSMDSSDNFETVTSVTTVTTVLRPNAGHRESSVNRDAGKAELTDDDYDSDVRETTLETTSDTKGSNTSGNQSSDIWATTNQKTFNKSQNSSSPRTGQEKHEHEKNTGFWNLIFLFVIGAIFVGWCNSGSNETETSPISNPQNLIESMEEIKKSFPSQEPSIWDEITVGIKEVMTNPEKPSMFLLLANENKTVTCLASKVGDMASRVLNGTGHGLRLNSENLEADTGKVIENKKGMIAKKKAVIVYELLTINSEALKAFHFMCDEFNPLVQEAVYVITMSSENYNQSLRPMVFAEQHLNKTFSNKIEQDILQPLIVRITGGAVLQIKNEPTDQLLRMNCD